MKILLLLVWVLVSASASAREEICYELSPDGVSWSFSPELLCITPVEDRDGEVIIVLKTNIILNPRIHATFNYSLLSAGVRGDRNEDVYGTVMPPQSLFNALSVRFDGKRDLRTFEESGTVFVGATRFYYRYSAWDDRGLVR